MKRTWRIVGIIVLVLAVAAAQYAIFGRERAPSSPDYQIVPVTRGTVTSRVVATGTITPRRQAILNFRSMGIVQEVQVTPGEMVEEGQLLARLDDRDFVLGMEQAEAALEMSRQQLAKIEAGPSAGDIAAAQASVASAQASYEKIAAGPSAEDIASARASLESAEASLRRLKESPSQEEEVIAKASLEQARIALEQAQSAYDKVAWIGGVGALPQSLQLQQATINYEAALANYQLATQGPTESQLKAAEAQVAQAKSALDRLLSSPTESELAMAEAQVVQAQAALDRLLQSPTPEDLAIAREQVRQAEIGLERAKLALEGVRLTAPFAGLVAQVNVREQQPATTAQPAIIIIDPSSFYVDVSIDELDAPVIAPNQESFLTLDALPGVSMRGHVEYIAPAATNIGGIVSYEARVVVDAIDERLRAGMTSTVEIITARSENALVVPNRAVHADRQTGKTYVEKLVNNKPVQVEVALGIREELVSEVLEGLQEGDQVIIRSQSSLEQLQRTISSQRG